MTRYETYKSSCIGTKQQATNTNTYFVTGQKLVGGRVFCLALQIYCDVRGRGGAIVHNFRGESEIGNYYLQKEEGGRMGGKY